MHNIQVAGYAHPIQLDDAQGDPLDLASTNERLYNTIFPGYNNVVRYIGVYSALSWMALQVDKHLKANPAKLETEAKELKRMALQKMELVLLWANKGGASIAGVRREFPKGNGSKLLKFSEWNNKASLMAAAQYGPSISNGLGFLNGNRACEEPGKKLAAAFEQRIGSKAARTWLGDISSFTVSGKQIKTVRHALNLHKPSTAEQAAFIEAFFPRRQIPSSDPRGRRRWSGLNLVLHSISHFGAGGADEDAIRAAMARGVAPSGHSVMREGLEDAQAVWAVLQLRQLQRMASESLVAVVGSWIGQNTRTGLGVAQCSEQLAEAAANAFESSGWSSVADLRQHFAALQGKCETMYRAAVVTPGTPNDLFAHLGSLETPDARTWSGADSQAAVFGLFALAFCAAETANLKALSVHARVLKDLRSDRASLSILHDSWDRFAEKSLLQWSKYMIGEWIFSRYFQVAIQRATRKDGKLRFDFSEGEFGLETTSVRGRPFAPSIAMDKLRHSLILCEQCDLVKSSGARGNSLYVLTKAGRARVDGYDANRNATRGGIAAR